jgi:NADH-quinone oxidoreductase subunit G/[NiFe] hydrogenase diaphorase moiety small subunit
MNSANPGADHMSRAPVSQPYHGIAVSSQSDAIGAMVSVSIDGQDICVPMGTTILAAARQLGIHIPTLCHHDDLCVAGSAGSAWWGWKGNDPSSQLRVPDHPADQDPDPHPQSSQARRHILDLLLSEHYGDVTVASATKL